MNVSYQASLVNRHIRRFTGTAQLTVARAGTDSRDRRSVTGYGQAGWWDAAQQRHRSAVGGGDTFGERLPCQRSGARVGDRGTQR